MPVVKEPQFSREVEVKVKVQYMPSHSDENEPRHAFAYTITMTNLGSRTVTLKSRYWLINDGDGRKEEVEGPGVIGEHPRLTPGESYEYSSGAILKTTFGSMEGYYVFESDAGETFRAPIDAFILSMPTDTMN